MKHYRHFLFFGILFLGAFLRFLNPNWDSGFHLHPDERFLTMVGNAMKLPNSFFDYMNPAVSTFNPKNANFGFFVYGIFPLTLNKILAIVLGNDDYFHFAIQGRILSAFFDFLIIIFIYKTVELFEKNYHIDSSIKFFSSFFYAIAVLPIQLSHFFAVDTFLNFFMFASFYFSLKFYFEKKLSDVMLSASFLGIGIACKITALFAFPLIAFFLLRGSNHTLISRIFKKKIIIFLYVSFLLLTVYFGISYLILRFTDPYIFENKDILNPLISSDFIQSIKTLSSFSDPSGWFPPAIQWINKPPFFYSLFNLAVFGIGIPYFLLILVGLYVIIRKNKKLELMIIIAWLFLFFIYQSIQFSKPMRYLIPIYPFLAIIAGFGVGYITNRKNYIYKGIVIFLTTLYPLMFLSIYVNPVTRISASEWIYKNIPNHSFILWEHWDDPLPLLMPENFGKQFKTEALPVFGMDTQEKINDLKTSLKNADYYILSSNRAWGSIMNAPKKYPLTSKFYKELFAERLGYKKVKEFTSYPSLRYLGIPIDFPDDWADESFTVYDHPKVIIFQKKQ